jgi:hypothetical protein
VAFTRAEMRSVEEAKELVTISGTQPSITATLLRTTPTTTTISVFATTESTGPGLPAPDFGTHLAALPATLVPAAVQPDVLDLGF